MNIFLMNATINGKLLLELLAERIEIAGVTQLDEEARSQTPEYYDYSGWCEEKGITCVRISSYSLKNEEDKRKLEKLSIDLLIIGSWQRLLPGWLIRHCAIGVIGAHGSHEGILRGRGRSPQNWALILGAPHFSFFIFWIEEGIDSGKIIDTREFTYQETDDILSSYIMCNLLKADMILKNLENGRIINKEGDI